MTIDQDLSSLATYFVIFGVTTRVSILDPGHLPRPEGKARRVIDKRAM